MIISEDYMIKSIMSESKEALSSGEISKKIYEKFKHRITKTTVKNYLWSSLRPLVHCNTEDWVYSLKKESEMLSPSSVFKVSTHPINDLPDYLRIEVLGDEVNCTYRDNLTVDEFIKVATVVIGKKSYPLNDYMQSKNIDKNKIGILLKNI